MNVASILSSLSICAGHSEGFQKLGKLPLIETASRRFSRTDRMVWKFMTQPDAKCIGEEK
jgi:hypothetical protein